jgi:NADPH-dependent 2,4-dienoyl-CoA reductase/sulfur reductase-like enzyme
VGGGFIGLEVASTAVQLGARVTVVEPLPAPLAGTLGLEIGQRIQRLHESNGVRVLTGVGVAQALGTDALEGFLLTDGRHVAARAAVVGIGSVPNTDWLAGAGLPVTNGVHCDEECRVVDEESIFAVGDIACVRHDDGRFARVEHWTNAVEHGERAARAILGIPTDSTPAPVPYFWSDQFGVKFQFVGRSRGAREDIVMCQDSAANGRQRNLAIYHDGERAIAALATDWPAAAGRMKKLLREPLSVDAVLEQLNARTGRPTVSGHSGARMELRAPTAVKTT